MRKLDALREDQELLEQNTFTQRTKSNGFSMQTYNSRWISCQFSKMSLVMNT